MQTKLNQFMQFLSSLKFSLFIFLFYFILVFVGTIDQVNLGIYYTQKKYFQSLFVNIPVLNFMIPLFPGGFLLGSLLLINLTAATIVKLKWKIQNIGLILSHFGLIFLLLGAGLTSCLTTESVMSIKEGESSYFSQDQRFNELAIYNVSDSRSDFLVSVPDTLLKSKKPINHSKLPFTVTVLDYYQNAQLTNLGSITNPRVSQGIGTSLGIKPISPFVRDDFRDNSTAIVAIHENNTEKKHLGNWLVSLDFNGGQELTINNQSFIFMLRPKRYYYPFKIKLNNFTHDRYAGTEIPMNFASDISLEDFNNNEFRDAKIYMNHPLRYQGKTFFQMSFGEDDTLSILQVVTNPGWLIPYISCVIMTIGLCIHFGVSLLKFRKKKT